MADSIDLYLIILAKGNDIYSSFSTSTTRLVERFNKSQQSVSRILKELEEKKYIERNITNRGVEIKITPIGIRVLKEYHGILDSHFCDSSVEICGFVTSGLGEGKYYVSLKGYVDQFKKKLNMVPYPGTLNLNIDESFVARIKELGKKTVIDGFSTKERTFGSLMCYECVINNTIRGYVVFAERTTHPSTVIEIIAEEHIRLSLTHDRICIKLVN